MQKWIVSVSGLIGAASLFCVMTLIFAAVALRYFFGFVVPDSYDLSRMLLGILIFWGIALAVADNSMIRVDALHAIAGPRGQRLIGAFAAIVTAVVLSTVAWRAGTAVIDAMGNKVSTSDLRIRLWPFYAVASTALLFAVLIALRQVLSAFNTGEEPDEERP